MNEGAENQSKSKKYKHTQELVRLALNSGWTQTDIGKACRVSQSVVSGWKKGKSKAKEAQVRKLLDVFGHKLRRKSFKVYWSLRETDGEKEWRFFRVEGRVIMDHTFHDFRRNEKTGKYSKNIPRRRLIVHDQGNGKYILLVQGRVGFRGSEDLAECCSYPAAAWLTEVVNSATMSKNELIKFIDDEHQELLKIPTSDAVTLPFLIRQALLYAGESVDGIVDYFAQP